MPDDKVLLAPMPTCLRSAVLDEPYRKYRRFALNPPERMPLPVPFQARDVAGSLRRTLERLVGDTKPPEAPKLAVDPRVAGWMEHRSPQFVLRNLTRVQREVDDWLEFSATPDARPDATRLLDDVRRARRRVAPAMVDAWSVDVVREALKTSARWTRHEAWNRHFSRELKADVAGPLWKHHAAAGEDDA